METTIHNLKFLLRTYDGITKQLAATKNRLKSLNPEAEEKHQDEVMWLESQKGRLSRKINKELEYWDIWTEWLKDIKGIGPYIAGNLIMFYYYRFIPICQKCGGDMEDFVCIDCEEAAKGAGVLQFRIEEKDFNKVSSWWHYLGEHNDPETGRMEKRKKGVKSSWGNDKRQISWQVGESINKCQKDHKYKVFYNNLKENGKKHYDAIRRTRKLFLSHFWHVARTLEGKSTDGPYAEVILKHTGIIPPYYWKEPCEP